MVLRAQTNNEMLIIYAFYKNVNIYVFMFDFEFFYNHVLTTFLRPTVLKRLDIMNVWNITIGL